MSCWLSNLFLSAQTLLFIPFIKLFLISLAHAFTVFIIPYYAYKYNYVLKHNNKSQDINQGHKHISPFWIFISETVWPVVISQIKVFFIILLYGLLIIIPGAYKAIRYTFVSHTVFFDDSYKQDPNFLLKFADRISRGYFWLIFLFIVLKYIVIFLVSKSVDISLFFLPSLVKHSLSVIVGLYLSWFILLFQSQFYFELKKARGETISC